MRDPDRNHLKDYPPTLRLGCASATLAKAIYYCRSEAFGIPVEEWDDLPWNLRQGLLEVAHRTLQSLEPAATKDFAALLFAYANLLAREAGSKVLALIAPRKSHERVQ